MALFEKLLSFYHISNEEYLELTKLVDLTNFNDGAELNYAKEASEFIFASMKQKDKIIIYGDYDADGIMATSIMVKMFKYKNYEVFCSLKTFKFSLEESLVDSSVTLFIEEA